MQAKGDNKLCIYTYRFFFLVSINKSLQEDRWVVGCIYLTRKITTTVQSIHIYYIIYTYKEYIHIRQWVYIYIFSYISHDNIFLGRTFSRLCLKCTAWLALAWYERVFASIKKLHLVSFYFIQCCVLQKKGLYQYLLKKVNIFVHTDIFSLHKNINIDLFQNGNMTKIAIHNVNT